MVDSPLSSPVKSPIPSPSVSLASSPAVPSSPYQYLPSSDESCNDDLIPEPKRRKYVTYEKKAPPTNQFWQQRQPDSIRENCHELAPNISVTREQQLPDISERPELHFCEANGSSHQSAADSRSYELQSHDTEENSELHFSGPEGTPEIIECACDVDVVESPCIVTHNEHDLLSIEDNRIDIHSCNNPAAAPVFSESSSSEDEQVSSSSSEDDEAHQSEDSSVKDESTEESSSDESVADRDSLQDNEISDSDSDCSDNLVSPKVFQGCDLSVEQGILVVMEFFLKHKVTKKAVESFLHGILRFLPKYNAMPKTQHSLFKYIIKLSPVSQEKEHFYCSQCIFYLGEVQRDCNLCGGESHKFYQLKLADQIKNLFENHGLATAIDKYRSDRLLNPQNTFSDLLDGSVFKEAQIAGQYNLTLLAHTDGISVSNSSDVSLSPLEYVISELPPHLRFKYILICGIWLDANKPYMNTFLKPFVEEVQNIRENGVTWIHPQSKLEYKTFVTVPAFSVDAPVRAGVQNILCHGGKHCCNLCEQKMKKLPGEPVVLGKKKKRRRRVYYFEEGDVTFRTADRMDAQGKETRRRHAERGGKLKAVKGVRGSSVISNLPGCDRSSCVFPEYMHLLLCLIKGFMKLWFLKVGDWSLKDKQDEINEFLMNIKVPDYLTRVPRSTEHFLKWKANELRSFLLYFSVIILSRCMEPEYFQHWLLLVISLFLLLQDSVSELDVSKSQLTLRLFCRDFPRLYKPDFYTYYVHNLIHLPRVVQMFGPLHCNSTFMFESFNGTLAKLIHGTKHQGKELINTVKLAFGVEVLKARNLPQSSADQSLAFEFRSSVKSGQYTLSDQEELTLLSCSCYFKERVLYYRAVIKGEVYTSLIYERQRKRNNFTVCYISSSGERKYGEVKFFVQSILDPNVKMAVVRKLRIDHLRTFSHTETGLVITHIIPIQETDGIVTVELPSILFKVIRIENYVCLRPNVQEVNL